MLDCGSSACFALGAAGIGEPTLCQMQAFFGQSCELASVLLTCAMALNVRALMVKRVPLRDLEVISLLNAPRILGGGTHVSHHHHRRHHRESLTVMITMNRYESGAGLAQAALVSEVAPLSAAAVVARRRSIGPEGDQT